MASGRVDSGPSLLRVEELDSVQGCKPTQSEESTRVCLVLLFKKNYLNLFFI
jgi:hypothetical protein